MAAARGRRFRPRREIKPGDLRRPQILDLGKAERLQPRGQRRRLEEADPGFTERGNPCRAGVSPGAHLGRQARGRIAVVEDHLAAGGHAADGRQRAEDRRLAQIGHDPEPGEEGGRARLEARAGKSIDQGLALEIDGRHGQRSGKGDARLGESPALPGLGGGMIDLEDAEPVMGIAIGEGVKARPEHDQLARAPRDGARQLILGKARARGDEEPHAAALWMIGAVAAERLGVLAQNGQRQGIGEDAPFLQELVRRAMGGGGAGRAARLSGLHGSRLEQGRAGINPAPSVMMPPIALFSAGSKCSSLRADLAGEDNTMRKLAFAAVFIAGATPALAAEPFNILGIWGPVAGASARFGPSPVYDNTTSQPSLIKDSSAAWSYDFDKQDGAAFAGTAKGPKGKTEAVVGVFGADGKRFVLSTETGSATGELAGDGIEICWTDNLPKYIGASCTIYRRR
jgi:hypothetical protein